jgi:PAS domain S-box-containing protein
MANIPDKEYENLLAQLKEYRELVENVNSIILRWTHDGRITFLNAFGLRFFGYSAAEIVGRQVIGTIVPETESSGRDLKLLMEEILKNPAAYEQNNNENMRRSGEHVWIAWTNKVMLDQQGRVKELLSIGQDISERKKLQKELEKRLYDLEELYQLTVGRANKMTEMENEVNALLKELGREKKYNI